MEGIIKWVRQNAATFLLSVALALIVYIIAFQENNPVIRCTPLLVEIEETDLGEDLVVTSDLPATTRLTLWAQEEMCPTISADDVAAVIDYADLAPGTYDIPLRVEHPQLTSVASLRPDVITVEIEEFTERDLGVQLIREGQPAVSFEISSIDITPQTATISGPVSLVEAVSEVRASVTLEENQREDISARVDLIPVDAQGRRVNDVAITPTTTFVRIIFRQRADVKEVSIRPFITDTVSACYFLSGLSTNPERVTLRGNPDILADIEGVGTEPINIGGLTEVQRYVVNLDLPSGVEAVDVEQVEVIVRVDPRQGNQEFIVPLRIENTPEGLIADPAVDEVAVLISGPQCDLTAIDPLTDITATLDLSDAEEGIGQFEVIIDILENDDIMPLFINPDLITVELTADE